MGERIMQNWGGIDQAKLNLKIKDKGVRETLRKGMAQAMIAMANRGKQIITELDHIDTSNLKRSLRGDAVYVSEKELVGTFRAGAGDDGGWMGVHYAGIIEALPDGGYFYRAYREVWPKASDKMIEGIKKVIDQK